MTASVATKLGMLATLGDRNLSGTTTPADLYNDVVDIFVQMFQDVNILKSQHYAMNTQLTSATDSVNIMAGSQIITDFFRTNNNSIFTPTVGYSLLETFNVAAGDTLDFQMFVSTTPYGTNNNAIHLKLF